MIFRSDQGDLKFHPCLEINCRFTMGAIALKLRDQLAEGTVGDFKILHGKVGYFSEYCRVMRLNEPLISENGKIAEGFIPLTPACPDCSFGAFLRVTRKNEITK